MFLLSVFSFIFLRGNDVDAQYIPAPKAVVQIEVVANALAASNPTAGQFLLVSDGLGFGGAILQGLSEPANSYNINLNNVEEVSLQVYPALSPQVIFAFSDQANFKFSSALYKIIVTPKYNTPNSAGGFDPLTTHELDSTLYGPFKLPATYKYFRVYIYPAGPGLSPLLYMKYNNGTPPLQWLGGGSVRSVIAWLTAVGN